MIFFARNTRTIRSIFLSRIAFRKYALSFTGIWNFIRVAYLTWPIFVYLFSSVSTGFLLALILIFRCYLIIFTGITCSIKLNVLSRLAGSLNTSFQIFSWDLILSTSLTWSICHNLHSLRTLRLNTCCSFRLFWNHVVITLMTLSFLDVLTWATLSWNTLYLLLIRYSTRTTFQTIAVLDHYLIQCTLFEFTLFLINRSHMVIGTLTTLPVFIYVFSWLTDR